MDFLNRCGTNVHAIEGFSHIYYRVYSITIEDNAPAQQKTSHSHLYLLQNSAMTIRKAGGYVTVDVAQLRLWVFGTSEERISQVLIAADSVGELDNPLRFTDLKRLKCISSGDIKTLDLLSKIEFSNNAGFQATVSNDVAQKKIMKGYAAYASSIQTSADLSSKPEDRISPLDNLYKFFIDAFVQSISCHMIYHQLALPLNFRTFAVTGANLAAPWDLDDSTFSSTSSSQTMDVDVELTTNGTLLMAFKRSTQNLLRPMNPVDSASPSVSQFLPLIRVGPGGRIFRLARKSLVKQYKTDEKSLNGGKIDSNAEPGGLKGKLWRQSVTEWLQGVGVPLSIDHNDAWVLISTPPMVPSGTVTLTQQKLRNSSLTFEWPAKLCFEYDTKLSRGFQSSNVASDISSRGNKELGTEWYQNENQGGLVDPLGFAATFLKDQGRRETEMTSRRSKKNADTTSESPGLATSAGGQEASLISSIYPTPPDGLLSGVTPGSSMVETSTATGSSVVGSRQLIGVNQNLVVESATRDSGTRDAYDRVDASSDCDTVEDEVDDGDDDLFESNGITEADFNFFDEPENYTQVSKPSDTPLIPLPEDDHNDMDIVETTEPSTSIKDVIQDTDVQILDRKIPTTPEEQSNVGQLHKIVQKNEVVSQEVTLLSPIPLSSSKLVQGGLSMQSLNTNPVKTMNDFQEIYRERAWNRINFRSLVGMSDKKYAEDGRFGFRCDTSNTDNNLTTFKSIKSKGLDHGMSPSNPRAYINITRRLLPSRRTSLVTSPDQARGHLPFSSDERETDDSSSDDTRSTRGSVRVRAGKRRKFEPSVPSLSRRDSVASGPSVTDAAPKPNEVEIKTSLPTNKIEMLLSQLFISRNSDWSLTNLPPPKERFRDYSGSLVPYSEDLIEIAQILAAQAATGSELLYTLPPSQPWSSHHAVSDTQDCGIISSLESSFSETSYIVQQTLLANVEFREETLEHTSFHAKHQPKPVPRRLKTGESGDRDPASGFERCTFSIPASTICLQKTEATWDLLPSAFNFWETLGLGPVNGQKSVETYCIYPFSEGIQDSIHRFLGAMESAWDSCRLGDHSSGSNLDGIEKGHVPVVVQGLLTQQSVMSATRKACESLGAQLANITREAKRCIVIYLVNPFDGDAAMQGLCACFYGLLKSFTRNAVGTKTIGLRPILQIVPIRLIASFESIVYLDSQTAAIMAREVYDRCPADIVAYDADLPITCAVSTILAETTPIDFHFQLTSEPPPDLLHERSCMNVAYCTSFDDRWITAAWTDEAGRYQHTACYNRSRGTSFENVAQEIWDSTLQYINPRKVVWQVVVVKAGPMENSEKVLWHKLSAATLQSKPPVSLVLVSVNTSPMLSIYPGREAQQQSPLTTATSQHQSSSYSTPMATPQAQSFSPVPTPPATTNSTAGPDVMASADTDPTARLFDLADESWGIVLGRRLSVSRSLVEYNPALSSGYLVKRTGPDELDQPVVMEVNLMGYVEAVEGRGGLEQRKPESEAMKRKKADVFLREILVMYRGLGLLARLRGMEGVGSCTPWHVSAVMKAEVALRSCM